MTRRDQPLTEAEIMEALHGLDRVYIAHPGDILGDIITGFERDYLRLTGKPAPTWRQRRIAREAAAKLSTNGVDKS